MSKQNEWELERDLVEQLTGMGYRYAVIQDEESLLANLKDQLEKFNGTSFSQREFEHILNHLGKGNVFERAKTLRDRFALHRDDGETTYLQFFNSENWMQSWSP